MNPLGRRTAERSRRVVETGWRIVRTLDFRRPSWARPLPNVRVHIGRWVPAWAVHGFAALVGMGCIATVTDTPTEWILPSILVGLLLVRPAGAPPALLALWFGLRVTTSDISGYTPKAAALVFGFHLLALLLITTGDVHTRTRIELRVFAGPLRRMGAIQAFVQPLAWATMTLAANDVTVRWLPIVAALAVVTGSWVLVRHVARVPDRGLAEMPR